MHFLATGIQDQDLRMKQANNAVDSFTGVCPVGEISRSVLDPVSLLNLISWCKIARFHRLHRFEAHIMEVRPTQKKSSTRLCSAVIFPIKGTFVLKYRFSNAMTPFLKVFHTLYTK